MRAVVHAEDGVTSAMKWYVSLLFLCSRLSLALIMSRLAVACIVTQASVRVIVAWSTAMKEGPLEHSRFKYFPDACSFRQFVF